LPNYETEVISAILNSENFLSDNLERLDAQDFNHEVSKTLFNVVKRLYITGKPINQSIVYTEMTEEEKKKVSVSLLMEIKSAYISDVMVKPHLKKLKDLSDKRKIMTALRSANAEIKAEKNSEEIIQNLLETLETISGMKQEDFFSTMPEVMAKIIHEMEHGVNDTSIKTGYRKLDAHTNGFYPGDLIVLGGRPSMGKTAFALSLMDRMAKNGANSLIFEMEMKDMKLAKRLIAQASKTNLKKMNTYTHSQEELSLIVNQMAKYEQENRIFMDTTPGISVESVRAKVKKYKQKYNINLVVIDHIGLMHMYNKDNENGSISHISKTLKQIAIEFDVVVLALSQLNRGVEQRAEKRPMLSDLRSSGSLEQDADTVMLIYRDSYYKKEEGEDIEVDELEINIAKGRDIGTTMLKFPYNLVTQYIGQYDF